MHAADLLLGAALLLNAAALSLGALAFPPDEWGAARTCLRPTRVVGLDIGLGVGVGLGAGFWTGIRTGSTAGSPLASSRARGTATLARGVFSAMLSAGSRATGGNEGVASLHVMRDNGEQNGLHGWIVFGFFQGKRYGYVDPRFF